MKVSLIVAKAENNAIGKDNDLIWHLPDDLRFFSSTTKGHHVIMGRKNYDSIPEKYRPLPNRPNIVVTRNTDFEINDCIVTNTVEKALEIAQANGEEEAFVIGGGQIYDYALKNDLVDKLYLTFVHDEFDADVYFPDVDLSQWKQISELHHPKDTKHASSYTIKCFVK